MPESNSHDGSCVEPDRTDRRLIAALDVFEDQPRVPEALRNSGRVLLTPHLGSATRETRARMGAMVLADLAEHFAGRKPAHLVDTP